MPLTRDQVVEELHRAGWPSVADDIAEGQSRDTVMARLHEIGEERSSAMDIVDRLSPDYEEAE